MAAGGMQLADPALAEARLLVQRPAWSRLDVAPFALLYISLHSVLLQCEPGSWRETQALVVYGVALLLHLLTVLFARWSVRVRAMVGYVPCAVLEAASHALVCPKPNFGRGAIVRLEHAAEVAAGESVEVLGRAFPLDEARLTFQSARYEVTGAEPTLRRLAYPEGAEVAAVRAWEGFADPAAWQRALRRWGRNVCDIPAPEFLELFLEQATAPFFLFQVLCVVLWSLDDYWVYSVFTLFMLVVFEATVTMNRLSALSTLRDMRRPASVVYAYRLRRWLPVSSEDLLPGDIISVGGAAAAGGGGGRPGEAVVPADVLLLSGGAIVNEAMLTGESVPQLKEALPEGLGPSDALAWGGEGGAPQARLQRSLLLGGTTILQANPGGGNGGGLKAPAKLGPHARAHSADELSPPDRGCPALVLSTGFGSAQGRLTLTLMFASERVTAASAESVVFICLLVLVALGAAGVVLRAGWADASRNRYKLVLHCIMIVTSVVPPELPMELSLAVTNSLQKLMGAFIFCTEPFRIPFAGLVSVCAFDKTGTLTSDRMICVGVVGCGGDGDGDGETKAEAPAAAQLDIRSIGAVPAPTTLTLAACQSLSLIRGTLVGDPMEQAVFEDLGWKLAAAGGAKGGGGAVVVAPPKGSNRFKLAPVRIVKRHAFNSDVKRMSVVAQVPAPGAAACGVEGGAYVFTKGAPEVVRGLLVAVPAHYDATYLHFMSKGYRVLALASQRLGDDAAVTVMSATAAAAGGGRAQVERDLEFCGFLLLTSTLKDDTAPTLRHIQAAGYRCIMITGDGPLTAAEVARQCGILSREPESTLALLPMGDKLCWAPLTADPKAAAAARPFSAAEVDVAALSGTHDLVVTGAALERLLNPGGGAAPQLGAVALLAARAKAFARVVPAHKEAVIHALNGASEYTLMCGDGANDVGALKRAHCGVSIISSPDLEERLAKRTRSLLAPEPPRRAKGSGAPPASSDSKGKPKKKGKVAGKPAAAAAAAAANPKPKPKATKPKKELDRTTKLFLEMTEADSDPTAVKLGDASIASPFTARRVSIDCVRSVLLQGRCTLVTTLQIYKILALNCLVSAFMMSFLFLVGAKQGDSQMTVVGIMVAALFFATSRAEPVDALSARRPPRSIFCSAFCISVLLQSAVHLAAIVAITRLSADFLAAQAAESVPDGPFRPSPFNGAVFLLSTFQTITTFVANYRGAPFMQSLASHKLLLGIALGGYVAATLSLLGLPVLTSLLELPDFAPGGAVDAGFKAVLLALMVGDALLCVGVELACRMLE